MITAENGRDGVELFRTCSDQVSAIRPDMPVVLTSGYNQQEALHRFDSKNLAGFLQKPFKAGELIKRIQVALTN
jgi:CheY-like chemotaxis protein